MVKQDRTRRELILMGSGGGRPTHDKVDVVIVGAGYAGPLMAKVLAESGKRVVVLESGPAWRSQDLISSQIWARRLRGGSEVRSVGANPVNIGFTVGRGLGGAGIHHYANWPRMHPDDFELRSRYGHSLDWPIGYDDLRPYYDRVQKAVGVSGDARQEIWRPAGEPYPLPPLDVLRHGHTLARGFRAMGLHTAPSPMAILSRPYRGRPACRYDGWCAAGCPIGALSNPLVTWIPAARRAGAEFRTGAHVLRVVMERDRAAGVEYVDDAGRRHVQRARVVVLAAFTLETPRILLNSAEGGLANSSGLVGAYANPHILTSVYALFPHETDPFKGPTGGQLICQDTYDHRPEKGYFGGHQWTIGAAVKPNDLGGLATMRSDIHGTALEPFLRRAAHHVGALTSMGVSAAARENRLTLVDERDRFGMPLAQLTHSFDADALALHRTAAAQGLEIMHAAGADDAWSSNPNTSHLMGGTIMGDDPQGSVVTGYGQTHDIENLFIATPGVFPTSGSVHPTFTLNAWTLRSAEFMRDHWHHLA